MTVQVKAFKKLWAALALGFLALLAWTSAHAQTALLPVPEYRAHVTDTAGVLSPQEQAALEQQLIDFEAQRGTQIGVLIVPSTAPEDIADYSQRVADAWKLGRAGVGDGLLLLVAVQDRRVRIAPFKALEGAVPDVLAKRIINEQIVPAFKQGHYAAGLQSALTQLQNLITGEGLPPAPASRATQGDFGDESSWMEALMLLLVAVPLVVKVLRQMLGQRLGSLVGAAGAGALVWFTTGRVWLALVAGLIGFFMGLFSAAPRLARRSAGGWGGVGGLGGLGGGGFGGGGFGGGWGGGASSGGGGDGGGGGASGSW